jgi:hypothetical protein
MEKLKELLDCLNETELENMDVFFGEEPCVYLTFKTPELAEDNFDKLCVENFNVEQVHGHNCQLRVWL